MIKRLGTGVMLRIITDFDGPIIDVSPRYYHVYLHCLEEMRHPGQSLDVLPKEEFWSLKRACVPERQIGKRSGLNDDQAKAFAKMRGRIVHSQPFLVHDQVVPEAIATLERIQALAIDLAVMTMRHTCELEAAFQQYELARFFAPNRRYCLPDGYTKVADVHDKPNMMRQALAELPTASLTWMIGDTEADIVAAQQHHIPHVAVLSGIRDRQQLEKYGPDYIASNIAEALELILQQAAHPKLHSA